MDFDITFEFSVSIKDADGFTLLADIEGQVNIDAHVTSVDLVYDIDEIFLDGWTPGMTCAPVKVSETHPLHSILKNTIRAQHDDAIQHRITAEADDFYCGPETQHEAAA